MSGMPAVSPQQSIAPAVPAAPPVVTPAVVTAAATAPPAAASPPVNVNVSQNVVVMQRSSGPGFLVRAVWFVFIGWWLSLVSIAAAYVLCVTIIGLPFGFAIFNRLPAILTLRPRTDFQSVEVRDGIAYVTGGTHQQHSLWLRAVWFVFVGWWVGAVYLGIAWFLCVIIVTLPIGLLMFNRVGAVMTLLKY